MTAHEVQTICNDGLADVCGGKGGSGGVWRSEDLEKLHMPDLSVFPPKMNGWTPNGTFPTTPAPAPTVLPPVR
jgi:hypothetical protein